MDHNVKKIEIKKIKANENNPRSAVGECKDLIASIKEYGVLSPIHVRKAGNGYEVVAGSRRFTACRELGMTEIPCIELDVDDTKAFELATTENLVRENMTKVDEAKAVARMVAEGRDRQEVASIFGKTPRWVEGRRKIVELGEKAMQMLQDGVINFGHAEMLTLAAPSDLEHYLEQCRYYTPEQLKKKILDERKALNKAPFDWKKNCKDCPNRSDCQQDLFGDVENAYCLNEDCFAQYVQKHIARATKDFEKAGFAAVPEDEQRQAECCIGSVWAYNYTDSESQYEDCKKKIERFKKAGIKARYFFDKEGFGHLAYRREDLEELETEEDEEEIETSGSSRYNGYVSNIARDLEKKDVENYVRKLFANCISGNEVFAMLCDAEDEVVEFEEANNEGESESVEDAYLNHLEEKETMEKAKKVAIKNFAEKLFYCNSSANIRKMLGLKTWEEYVEDAKAIEQKEKEEEQEK